MPTKKSSDDLALDRFLYAGLIRLHMLHHAVEANLRPRHDRGTGAPRLSDWSRNSLPLLHGLEKRGYLRVKEERRGKSLRKVYRATPLGKKALDAVKSKVRELFRELVEGE